jgi:DNA repair exonuclease SbcCD ATPase subunit
MANRDFFDDDLNRAQEAERRAKLAADDLTKIGNEGAGADGVPVRSVSDLTITRMSKHKQELDSKVAGAMEELEKLRKRQEDLDRQRKDLEDLRKRQEDYQRGKQEMSDRLNQSLVTLEKEEIQASRLAELLSATRKRFKAMLGDVQSIDEETWPEDSIRDELNKAATLVDDIRMEYNKAVAKIDAISGDVQAPAGTAAHPAVIFEEGRRVVEEVEKGFGYWIKVGLAITLPLIVVLVILAVVLFFVRSNLI